MSTATNPTQPAATAPTPENPKIEVTINTKPITSDTPKLRRQTSNDSVLSTSTTEEIIRPRPARRTRRDSCSPIRIQSRFPPINVTPLLSSSTQLLDKIGYDGIADMPFPGRNSIYLTTFPFTNRDVKKWAWLFTHGVEDVWLTTGMEKRNREEDYEAEVDDVYYDGGRWVSNVPRNRRRDYDPILVDMPTVYLSRALDTTVLPEDTTEEVKYLIVLQNRNRPSSGTKLLTAESRKAAGIMMYYEALTGNSTVFVGAVVGGVGKKTRKFKKVEGVEEAKGLSEDGVVGVIC